MNILGAALIVQVNGDEEYGDKKDYFSDHLGLCSLDGFENKGTEWDFFACGIGGILLFISRLIGGGIGEGDGWFFVVAGLFLSPGENGLLLLSGIFLSGIFSLLYVVAGALNGTWQRHRKSFPFLPFLLPAGLWITFAGK